MTNPPERQRIDKWLWAARFCKTRAVAVDEIGRGRVLLNGAPVKPGRELRVGDTVRLRQGVEVRTVVVRGLGTCSKSLRGGHSSGFGRSAALQNLPIARAIGGVLRLASHPKPLAAHSRRNFEQVLSAMRGPAPVARQLYVETADSLAARLRAAEARRLAPEPALGLPQGRPTKRDRRQLDRQRRLPADDAAPLRAKADWGRRWSATLDGDD